MRRVLITGSRRWTARTTVWQALAAEYNRTVSGIIVVHGGATGADDIADRWAWGMKQQGWQVIPEMYRADWESYGRVAGTLRNQKMVNQGAEVCLAFPLIDSIGTFDCMARAERAGIPVKNFGYKSEVVREGDQMCLPDVHA